MADDAHRIECGDCLELLGAVEPGSVDLCFASPPYEDARLYGIGFELKGDAWVQWAADRFEACYFASGGLTAWVVAGRTRDYQWSASPALLMAELHRRGVALRNPAIFHRVGIPGSGGPDWLRSDYEWIVCAAAGRMPWSDNTACGSAPKYGPGGVPSHRLTNGDRANVARMRQLAATGVSQREAARESGVPLKGTVSGMEDGDFASCVSYVPPAKANPGNVINVQVGGGKMGSKLAHENEAPFPEKLAEFFIRSFCPPGGLVLDPFSGSGTTAAVAKRLGRRSLSFDVRQSQCDLTRRRLAEVVPEEVTA